MTNRLDDFPDIRALQILDALFEARGVSSAAHRMGLSQPAVSRTLADLRRHFDDPLLIRAPGGMVLTPRAEALRVPLAQWLAAGRAMLDPGSEDPVTAQRRFRIAASDYGMMAVVGPAMAQIHRQLPRCRLIVEPLSGDSPRRMLDGALDLLITGFEPDPSQFHLRPLFEDEFTCLVRAGHPALDVPPSLDSFLGWPHIAVMVAETDSDHLGDSLPKGRERPVQMETHGFAVAPLIAAQCDAVVILPRRAAQLFAPGLGLRELPMPVELERFGYWLAWHERSRRDAALMRLVDILQAATRGD